MSSNPHAGEDVAMAGPELADGLIALLTSGLDVEASLDEARTAMLRDRATDALTNGVDVDASLIDARSRHTQGEMPPLRGNHLEAVHPRADDEHVVEPGQPMRYACPRGHEFDVPLVNEAEIPATWECRLHGSVSRLVNGLPAEQKRIQSPRTHWDILLERRSVADLEVLLNERLEALEGDQQIPGTG